MDRDSIKDVMKDVFGANFAMKDIGDWVSCACVFAPFKHANAIDNHPSAGISCDPDGTSIYNCFTCHTKGPFHRILAEYGDLSGEDLGDLVDELEENEFLGPRALPSWDRQKEKKLDEIQTPLDEGVYMDLYDSAAGHPYLKERGISDATARKLELLFDPKGPTDNEPRILFPIRGYDGLLYGFSGRAISGKAALKVRDYHGLRKALNLLGAHLVAKDNPKQIILVEGLFDYAKTHENGYHGCAAMHSTLTEAQAAIIRDMGKPTYMMWDNPKVDKAGDSAMREAGKLIYRYVPTMITRYPDIEIYDKKEKDYRLIKDAGELLREDIEEMIKDSRLYMPPP